MAKRRRGMNEESGFSSKYGIVGAFALAGIIGLGVGEYLNSRSGNEGLIGKTGSFISQSLENIGFEEETIFDAYMENPKSCKTLVDADRISYNHCLIGSFGNFDLYGLDANGGRKDRFYAVIPTDNENRYDIVEFDEKTKMPVGYFPNQLETSDDMSLAPTTLKKKESKDIPKGLGERIISTLESRIKN